MKYLFSIFLVLVFLSKGFAQDTIRVTDFGYEVGSRINAVPAVKKAIAECHKRNKPVLLFPKGRYDFWPQYCDEIEYFLSNTDVIPLRTCPILFKDLNNIVVEGDGSEFIFHGRMQPITLENCENVKLKNINIDWDFPLMAQAEVIKVTDQYIELKIDVTESPYILENNKIVFVGEGWKSPIRSFGIMEFDRNTRLIRQQGGDAASLGDDYEQYTATEVHDGLVRLNHRFKKTPLVGNFLVLRHNPRDHAGTFVYNSKNISFENFNMYQNSGLGILSQYSENLSFTNVNCIPNLAKNRYFGGHDDGLHFSGCKGKVLVDNCTFKALMDDPINVHGTNVKVIERLSSRSVLCRFMQIQTAGFEWAFEGDTIGFIENSSMETIAKGIVAKVTKRNIREFEIEFADEIPVGLEVGNALENITWSPEVHIKNSFFGSNRARGILVTTPKKVLIENNTFESSGSAILISGDANGWYESGAVQDVLIQNNTFNDPCNTSSYEFCEAIISIYPEIPNINPQKPFHRNIRIENNLFMPFDYPVLYAKSVKGLTFSGNTINRSYRFSPFHHRKDMLTFDTCSNVIVENNKLSKDVLGRNIKLLNTPINQVKVDKMQNILITQ